MFTDAAHLLGAFRLQVQIAHYLTDEDSIGQAICRRAKDLNVSSSPAASVYFTFLFLKILHQLLHGNKRM